MIKLFRFTLLLFLFISSEASAQTMDVLRQEIKQIISTKNAIVGISIMGANQKDTLSVNGEQHFPLQSVFKFHIALAVLAQIDQGKLSFDQKIEITKKDLQHNLYSAIRTDYPDGGTLTLSKILEYTVSKSDNVGCDALLKLIGGPQAVEAYFVKNNFKDVSIKLNEETQQSDWDLQFQNWTTPNATIRVLASFYYNKEKWLSPKSYDFIWKVMKETSTGEHRLKAGLPANTTIAHKTGTSGTNKEGVTAAVNDIGVVFLPNGQHYFISVFVTNSRENEATNEKIIADISKAAWEYFIAEAK